MDRGAVRHSPGNRLRFGDFVDQGVAEREQGELQAVVDANFLK
jgi:hypothetical protein